MRFWDTSAIIPLVDDQDYSSIIRTLLQEDNHIAVWWGTKIECYSALSRLWRDTILNEESFLISYNLLEILHQHWTEILPGNDLRNQSIRAISIHGLKTLDSLQLAAALLWADNKPTQKSFLSLDKQLRNAALKEGFTVLPTSLTID
jgi:predicted nucleic acid-binding protein